MLVLGIFAGLYRAAPSSSPAANPNARAHRAFERVAQVLNSPRCANCHIAGDSPLQGDERQPHTMNVKRGLDGRGTPSMRCTNCHQEQSSDVPHAPPGGPDWRLPLPNMRMAWQGLSPGDMCRMLKDPSKNGNRSLADLLEHVTSDRLVKATWNPGVGRSLPPMSHAEFVASFQEWVNAGAACAP